MVGPLSWILFTVIGVGVAYAAFTAGTVLGSRVVGVKGIGAPEGLLLGIGAFCGSLCISETLLVARPIGPVVGIFLDIFVTIVMAKYIVGTNYVKATVVTAVAWGVALVVGGAFVFGSLAAFGGNMPRAI